ncbi:zinc-binding protein A33-like isoform X2 [Colius striatus]|nr:zinc-binding protein A33-like isoform X2 [Colius striatus]XP_061858927.1 zinc-binding protein A33-like isoform X2 [Colius striatus]XP_061858928.1 zinc-binding protein A33-like isoform X2 [Colius striatus]XP_061858929.1 zinc-binding protein A33-like isoform X2 [Colius striatus]XP_061858930.1 zinc-binding protein A33-like isoform X2 [Colius striatus]
MAGRSQDRSLREELTCAICCELFSEPVMLDCMHHFCRACIQRYWESCAGVPSCPQCRRPCPSRAFRTHYLLSGLVEKVRRCSSAEHQHRMQKRLEDALQARRKEMENFSQRKHAAQRDICGLMKVSGELNFKIRAEFSHLRKILEEEERAVLAELGEKKEQALARLRGDVCRLEEGMSVLQRDIEHIEQTLSNMEEVSLLEVESLDIRPLVRVETQPAFDLQHYGDRHSGPLQYIFWRQMLRSIQPAPAPLTFDPESAHPNLIFSRDLTAVTERSQAQPVPCSPRRFRQCVNVLGSQMFASGQHYWEVWVGSKTKWDLGVAAEAVDRAAKVKLCPENGYWTLRLRNRTEYWATSTPWVRLTPCRPLRKVGVFLDCQEGTVTFFNAGDMSHLFTFHQVSAERYCPLFSTCFSDGGDNVEPMRLCHLAL